VWRSNSGGPTTRASVFVKHWDNLLNFITSVLDDALTDPLKVADFLLFQLDVSVEHSHVRLAVEAVLQVLNFHAVEAVIEVSGAAFTFGITPHLPQCFVVVVRLQNLGEVLQVSNGPNSTEGFWEEVAHGRDEVLARGFTHLLVLAKVSGEGVDADVDRALVSGAVEDVRHVHLSFSAEAVAESAEVLQVRLVHEVLQHDEAGFSEGCLGVISSGHVLAVVLGALQELREVVADGCGNQHRNEQLLEATLCGLEAGDAAHVALADVSQRVATLQHVSDVSVGVVQGVLEDEDDVVDHVLVGDEVQESGEFTACLGADVLELVGHLLLRGFADHLRAEGELVLQEVSVVGFLQTEAHISEVGRIAEVEVFRLGQERLAVTANQSLGVSVQHIEGPHIAVCLRLRALRRRQTHLCK